MEILSLVLAVKLLTVTTFEDEAKRWVEGEKLTRAIEIPGNPIPLRCNEKGHCLLVTGMGTANASAAMMAIGLHPKIDLKKAHVMLAGVAGGNATTMKLGGAAWAKWVVGSDDRHALDWRELPKGWKFTSFRLGCRAQWCKDGWTTGNEIFHLDEKLVDRAVALTKGDAVQCDVIAGGEYFHGAHLSDWATWWVDKWTGGKGRYCTSAMEDAGFMAAVKRLAAARLVDADRVLVLRAVANLDRPGPKQNPLESMQATGPGLTAALESAYRVGAKVAHELLKE